MTTKQIAIRIGVAAVCFLLALAASYKPSVGFECGLLCGAVIGLAARHV